MTNTAIKLPVNRIIHDSIESDVVYPLDGNKYHLIALLEPKWVKQMLRKCYQVDYINNKYAIAIRPFILNNQQIWYQHDDQTWIIEPAK